MARRQYRFGWALSLVKDTKGHGNVLFLLIIYFFTFLLAFLSTLGVLGVRPWHHRATQLHGRTLWVSGSSSCLSVLKQKDAVAGVMSSETRCKSGCTDL